MRKHRSYYRTSDGQADFQFAFEKQMDGTWRIYIEKQPSYGNKLAYPHITHRMQDGSRWHIDPPVTINSLEHAKCISVSWAEKTQRYIRMGYNS